MTTGGQPLRWGRPPLAFVPAALAGRLATVRVPDWLAELLDGPGTVAAALTADAWERLPQDEAVRRQVRHYVLALVGALVLELRDVPIGAVAGGGAEPPGPAPWPARARGALLGSGVRPDPHRCYTLTFGEVLDVPRVGVCTALETAALLELSLEGAAGPRPEETAAHRPVAHGPAAVPILRWGKPGCPLLPRSLRRAFAATVLPASVSQDLHLPPGTTALALGTSVWRHADGLSRRTEEFLLGLVDRRGVRALRVMEDLWSAGLHPEEIPWPKRVRHSLHRAGLLTIVGLERLTYGDLLAVPSMGKKSALEFAAIADALAPAVAEPVDDTVQQAFLVAAKEDWTERVRASDPRFRDVVPPYAGSLRHMLQDALDHPQGRLAHVLADALVRIQARADEIAAEPIDLALARLAGGLGISERDMTITGARLGWNASGRRTLRDVANEHALSRERVRQLTKRTMVRIGHPYLPQIERAGRLLAERAPITGHQAACLLVDHGLSTIPINPASIEALADLTGYEVTFQVDVRSGVPLVLAPGQRSTGAALAAARRRLGRDGICSVNQLRAALAARGHDWPVDGISPILRSLPGIEFLDAEWFWVPGAPPERNRLRKVTRRMLSVTPRLDVETLRQGMVRHSRDKRVAQVPPISTLTAFYVAHPDFVVSGGHMVESTEPIDYRDVLSNGEQAFVEALRAAPAGLLHRTELRDAAVARGIGDDYFSHFTIHSPILDHPARDIWCLRGAAVDPRASRG